MSDAWCDQCDRYYDPSKEHDCRVMAPEEAQANRLPHAWRPAWKRAAEAGGTLPSADGGGQWTPDPQKPDHYTFGPLSAERTITLTSGHIATLPTGERVELPAGTVLREGTLPPEAEDIRPTLGEQIHDEHDRVLRDLTERVGLPREMAPSVERDPNDSSWAARYTEAMRVNAIQRAEIERLHKALEDSATPADRAVGADMLGALR